MNRPKLKASSFLSVLVFLFLGFLVLGISIFSCVFCKEKRLSKKIFAAEEAAVKEEKAAEEITPTDEEITEEPAPTPTPEPVDYYLVYPGILPDHFLYPLKMVRDRIWLLLTTGAERKAEVMLLFADKRLGAGKALIEGGKEKLGITTITKGEKYLEEAVDQLGRVVGVSHKVRDPNISELVEKFSKAAAKHEEVLGQLKEKVSTEEWGAMDEMLGKIKMLREKIDSI